MDNKNQNPQNQIKIDVTPETAGGVYANLAVISHTPGEFFLDFISVVPNMSNAKVVSRVVINPENAKNLLFTLRDNIQKYESTFGEIQRKVPVKNQGGDDIPNPFMA